MVEDDCCDDDWNALHLKFIYSTALYFTVLRFRPQGGRAPNRIVDDTTAPEVHVRAALIHSVFSEAFLVQGRVRAVARTSCEWMDLIVSSGSVFREAFGFYRRVASLSFARALPEL